MNGCIYLNISNCRIYMDLVFIREKTNLVMWKKTKVFDREVLAATISQTGVHLKYAYFSNELQLQYSYRLYAYKKEFTFAVVFKYDITSNFDTK